MHKLLNKSQVKVILEIFKNPGINLREIITNTKLSPNFVSDYVNDLIKREMLTEEKLEKKRVYLRRFFLNFDSTTTQHFFKLIKEEEKQSFFEKYPKLKSVFVIISLRLIPGFLNISKITLTCDLFNSLCIFNKLNKPPCNMNNQFRVIFSYIFPLVDVILS